MLLLIQTDLFCFSLTLTMKDTDWSSVMPVHSVRILTRTMVLLVWARWGCAPGAPWSLAPLPCVLATAPDVPFVQTPAPEPALLGLCFMPSSRRTRRMLLGSSSTAHSTNVRHSGQRSSPREPRMPWRHLRQKVCWQGRTFAEASSRSRQTGHSSKSSNTDSSILRVLGLQFRKAWCWSFLFLFLQMQIKDRHVTPIPWLWPWHMHQLGKKRSREQINQLCTHKIGHVIHTADVTYGWGGVLLFQQMSVTLSYW